MNTSFSIELSHIYTGGLFGLFVVKMKETKMTRETLNEMINMLQHDFHFILSHLYQEGELEEEVFCQTAYQHIIRAKDRIANFFGEDAEIILDRNVEFYRDVCMDMIFRVSLELTLGAPSPLDENLEHWDHTAINENTMERVVDILSAAEVM